MQELFIIFLLIQVKHWLIDFVMQTDEELAYKGDYWDWRGMTHSLKHGILTLFVLWIFLPLDWAVTFAVADFFVHYHIDWIKMNFGCKDIKKKEFWVHFGLDQLAHQLTYLAILYTIVQ